MGRRVLLIALFLGGCTSAWGEKRSREGPHADLACAACHQGGTSDRAEPAVPAAACTASGCHEDAGPARARLGTVDFEHRQHGREATTRLGCAGCHAHDEGTGPLVASNDGCALCHAEKVDGDVPADCESCHRQPEHDGVTSQGLPIPHEQLPWVSGECVRCHYDVARPPVRVSSAVCVACHEDLDAVTRQGAGVDLHPGHTEVGCTACHGEGGHGIVAMSSAVELECSQCHESAHDVPVSGSWPGTATCNACHDEVHQDAQRLLLGVLPGDQGAVPSEKFLAGLTCRSCHVGGSADAGRSTGGGAAAPPGSAARKGTPASCTGCHRAEYATVLRWWQEGTEQRRALAEAYLTRAEGALPRDDTVRTSLQEARSLVELVGRGGGHHNLPLAHRVLARSLEEAQTAWRAAGRMPPEPPALGRAPQPGLCTYCHYRLDDPWKFGEMSGAFHRDAMGIGAR